MISSGSLGARFSTNAYKFMNLLSLEVPLGGTTIFAGEVMLI